MKKNILYFTFIFILFINGCTNDTKASELDKKEKTEIEPIKVESTKTEAVTMKTKTEPIKVVQKTEKELFAKCSACHGSLGQLKALGKSAIIAGQNKDILFKKLVEYKKGTRNISGMGALMKSQLITYSIDDLKKVSKYISTF